jgi:transcription initiation factor TFIIIB Brf1 subunit/transcription initiation factor TFIIB
MELGGQQYTLWKNELIMMERYILKELGFSLYNIMDHPHKYILYFVKVLNGSEALANTAWSYLNDSMRLDISLRFEAQAIACAAIYLAGHKLGVALPESEEAGPWWRVFGASTRDVQAISDAILTIYESPKVRESRLALYLLATSCSSS